MESYSKRSGFSDNVWWYNERATLSSLAGAAWRTPGWVALEEFNTKKHGRIESSEVEEGNKGRLSLGRCDLYLESKTRGYAIEAKQAWQAVGPKVKKDSIGAGMKKAWDDTGKLTVDEADFRVGLVFAVPHFPASSFGDKKKSVWKIDNQKLRNAVAVWVAGQKETVVCDAYAHYFPEEGRHCISDKDRIYPGVAAYFKLRLRAAKHSG